MFGRAFLGEFKKLIRPKGLIGLAIVFIIFFILFAVFYNLNLEEMMDDISDILQDSDLDMPIGDYYFYDPMTGETMTEEEYAEAFGYANVNFFALANENNVDKIIDSLNSEIAELTVDKKAARANNIVVTKLRGSVTMLKYMRDNGLYGEDLNIEGAQSYLTMRTAENFTMSYFSTVVAIMIIYGIVVASGLYADEYKRGTIKLVMLRPISRNGLTLAKLTACITYLVSITGIMSLIAYIYGLICFKSASLQTVYVVFNQTSVFKTTAGGVVFYNMFFMILRMCAMVILSFTIGTVTRRKTLSIIISYIIQFGLLSLLLSFMHIDRFLFSTSTDLGAYFGIYSVPFGGNFFLSLGMLVIYLGLFLTALFVTVKKRDII